MELLHLNLSRRRALTLAAGATLAATLPRAALAAQTPENVLTNWYKLVLELVRHTPTYSPPVASRAFAYLGVTAYEALASGTAGLAPLSGQLTDLPPAPARQSGAFDEAAVLNAALTSAVSRYFENTGPTGQRAMKTMADRIKPSADPQVLARSTAHGQAIADHIWQWSQNDGGAVVENLGFPYRYTPLPGNQNWVPTSKIILQQAPLLPDWGKNRPLARPSAQAPKIGPPPAYSEDPASEFYKQAREVYDVSLNPSDDHLAMAYFWSDDAMLSYTPPGHWIVIAMAALAQQDAPASHCARVLALLGVTVADAFIACWQSKYEYNLVRPVTYINRLIDPKWKPLLITPPFPEYPSGHSTQSGAAAAILTHLLGDNHAFTDDAQDADGLPSRSFTSFNQAAEEAAISRLYGGIHFRAAIENGVAQGRQVATFAAALKTES